MVICAQMGPYSDEEGELETFAAKRVKNSCYLTPLRKPLPVAMLGAWSNILILSQNNAYHNFSP